MKTAKKKAAAPARSVVIVDDQKPFVDLMARMIGENLTCKVHPFTRPDEALKGLEEISAGVIVTDYSMPEMNGVEFIKKAAKIAPEAVFIMISGHDLELIDHELSRLKKLKRRIQKPFSWLPLTKALIEVWPGNDVPSFRE